jgi:hypothetical protein
MAVFDSILTAADDLEVDLSAHLGWMLCQVAADARAFSEAEANAFAAAIDAAARRSESKRVRRRIDRHMNRHPVRVISPPEVDSQPVRPAFVDGWVRLDAQDFDISDAAGAAAFAARFYDWTETGELPATLHRLPGRLPAAIIRVTDAVRVRVSRGRLTLV